MAKLLFTNKAVSDLGEIWNYTAELWSIEQANSYYNLVLESCNKLLVNPKIGKDYKTIRKCLRGFISKKHIIFYLINKDLNINVVRILHQKMDIKSHFKLK